MSQDWPADKTVLGGLTLVDIAVRPSYAGGPKHVLNAYRHVVEGVVGDRLVADLYETLDVLRHVYPYHQAVGFYLEKAGMRPAELDMLRERGIQFDFYICNRIEAPVYNPSWHLFVPPGLIES